MEWFSGDDGADKRRARDARIEAEGARKLEGIRSHLTEQWSSHDEFRAGLIKVLGKRVDALRGLSPKAIRLRVEEVLAKTPVRFADAEDQALLEKQNAGAKHERRKGAPRGEVVFNRDAIGAKSVLLSITLLHELIHELGGDEITAHLGEAMLFEHMEAVLGGPGEGSDDGGVFARKVEEHKRTVLAQVREKRLERHVARTYPEELLDLRGDKLAYLHDSLREAVVLKTMLDKLIPGDPAIVKAGGVEKWVDENLARGEVRNQACQREKLLKLEAEGRPGLVKLEDDRKYYSRRIEELKSEIEELSSSSPR